MVAFWVLAALVLLPGVARLTTDNSPEIFFPQRAREVADYQHLLDTFGNDQAMRVMASGAALWSDAGLAWLQRFERELAREPSIEALFGPIGTAAELALAWPPADVRAWRERLRADPVAGPLALVAGDGEAATATLLVLLTRDQSPGAALAALDALVRADPPPAGVKVEPVGVPVLDQQLNRSSLEIAQQFFPLLVLFAVVLLAAAFRTLRGVVLPLVFVAVCQATLFGAMGYLGVQMNLLLSVLAPLLFVISLATSVHLLIRCRNLRAEGCGADEAVLTTYRDKGWAVLWTGLTTLVGFASLTVSTIVPVRSLGFWFGAGILSMTAAAFTLYPALLASWPGRRPERDERPIERTLRACGERWARWAVARRWGLLSAMALTAVIAVAGMARLRVESDALRYLAPEHPLRQAVDRLEASGVGTSTIELVLTLPAATSEGAAASAASGANGSERGFLDDRAVVRLTELGRRLELSPEVYATLGVPQLLAGGLQRAGAAGAFAGGPLAAALAVPTAEQQAALGRFLSDDRRQTRITVFTPTAGVAILDAVRAAAEPAAAELFPQATLTVTGQYSLLLGTQQKLLFTLAESFALTALGIFLMLRFLVRSWLLALLAMPANLWPILLVLGAMGWSDTPLDIATVMVASMILGLAVDDSLHTLGHLRHLAAHYPATAAGRTDALAATLRRTAAAYLLTGVILTAGFGVCALSQFAPTSRFGLLAASGIALAVLADLVLLPAMLAVVPAASLRRLWDRT